MQVRTGPGRWIAASIAAVGFAAGVGCLAKRLPSGTCYADNGAPIAAGSQIVMASGETCFCENGGLSCGASEGGVSAPPSDGAASDARVCALQSGSCPGDCPLPDGGRAASGAAAAIDGCTSCRCEDGGFVACADSCVTDGGVSCRLFDGGSVRSGERGSPAQCVTCTCNDGNFMSCSTSCR